MTTATTQGTNAHILSETVCTLKDVVKIVPTRPCFATVWRWTQRGVRGHRLETYQIGGRVITSQESVHRFLEATQAQD